MAVMVMMMLAMLMMILTMMPMMAVPTKNPRFRKGGAVGRDFRSLDRFLLSRVCS